MYLSSLSELMSMTDWTDWDFVINMSESSYPFRPMREWRDYLTANKGFNFVASHGPDQLQFVWGEAVNRAFVECDERLWRIGYRNIQIGLRVLD